MAATTDANTAIKNRLAAMSQFHPATVNLFDGWLLDPGDIVTVAQGETDYSVPIYRMDMTWKGSSRTEIQSTGSEKRPPLSALKRRSYATGRRQAEDEDELIRHRADIEKSNERILLWATEEEWAAIAEQYVTTHKTELELVNDALDARVTQTTLTSTLAGYLTITANQTILGNVMAQDGKVTAASIMTAVNAQGSEAYINADHVYITGNTLLSGQVTVEDGALKVKTSLIVSGSTNGNVSINNGTVSAKTHQVSTGGSIVFVGSSVGEHYDLTAANIVNFIKEASVSGNVLTLTPVYGNPITFSKATTLTGAWSSGSFPLTISASPQGETYDIGFGSYGDHDIDLELVANGSASVSSSAYSIDVPLAIKSLNSGQTAPTARYTKSLTVAVGSLLESKTGNDKITSNGTYTPSSGKIGFSSVEIDVSSGGISSVTIDTGSWVSGDTDRTNATRTITAKDQNNATVATATLTQYRNDIQITKNGATSRPSPNDATQMWTGSGNLGTGVTVNNTFYNFYVDINGVRKYYYFYVSV